MTAEFWTAQLRIVKGEASEESPEIAYAERHGSGNRRDRLYILAEPARAGSERFIGEMVTRIGEEFLTAEGSLTGIMQRSLRARHTELRDWNRRSLPKDRASYGISCLLLRDDLPLLCQLGPSLAYTCHGSNFVQYVPREKRAARALGIAEVANPEFHHVEFGADGYILLISRAAHEIFSDAVRERLQDTPPDEVLASLYPFLITLPSVSALVVAPLSAVAYLTPAVPVDADVAAASILSQREEPLPDAEPIQAEPMPGDVREMGEAASATPIEPPPGLEGERPAAGETSYGLGGAPPPAPRAAEAQGAPSRSGGSSETPASASLARSSVLDTITGGLRRILGWRHRTVGDDPWKAVEPGMASSAGQGRQHGIPKAAETSPSPLSDLWIGSAAAVGSIASDRIDPVALVLPPFEPAEFHLPGTSNEPPSPLEGGDLLGTAVDNLGEPPAKSKAAQQDSLSSPGVQDDDLADPSSHESPPLNDDGPLPSHEKTGESADGGSGKAESIYGLGEGGPAPSEASETAAQRHGSPETTPRRLTESRDDSSSGREQGNWSRPAGNDEDMGEPAPAPPPLLEPSPASTEAPPDRDDPPAHASLLGPGGATATPPQAVNPLLTQIFPLSLPQQPPSAPPFLAGGSVSGAATRVAQPTAATAVADLMVGQVSWLEGAHAFEPAELVLEPSATVESAAWPANPFSPLPHILLPEKRDLDATSATNPLFGLRRIVPNLHARSRPRGPESGRQHGWGTNWTTVFLVLGGTIGVLVIIGGVLLVPDLLRESQSNQVDRLIAEARLRFRAASLEQEPQIVREELELAVASVAEALESEPANEEAVVLQAEIETALQRINLIVRPDDVAVALNLGTLVAPPFALGEVEVGQSEIYLLDESGGRVFAWPIEGTGEPVTVLRQGDLVGTTTVAAPVDVHWSVAESSLYILDTERQLFRYAPGAGLSAIGLPDAAALGSVDAVTAEGTAVYLLDVAGGSVWRYSSGPDGSLIRGTPVLERTELTGANSIVVAGAIFVASSDGRLRRFFGGGEQAFTEVGLDRPLLFAASLKLGSQTGLIYAVDRGNNRVVVFDPSGGLRVQIRDDLLAGLRGVAVDEAAGRLYYVTPDALLTSALPAFPSSAAAPTN